MPRGLHALEHTRGHGPRGASERLQLDLQRGERLSYIVVQVAGKAPALLFLDPKEAARQRAQPLFGHLERSAGGEMALVIAPLFERAPHRAREAGHAVLEHRASNPV
jgi:hypothetical protein